MDIQLSEYLHNNGFEYKERNGEIYLKHCPDCEQPEDGDFTHISFNAGNGLFRCKKCDYQGNLWKFALDRGHVLAKAGKKAYVRPDERPELLTDTEKFYSWYEKERGIKSDILKAYRVGLHKADSKNYITYQFYNEEGHLVNRKYRGCKDKKEQWQEKDAEPIYYGLDKVDFKSKIMFVCEGEDDCHALAQIGLSNVVSVPHGASNYTPAMDKTNRQIDTLVLMFDNDEAGQKGARKFADKAGLHKCINVVLPYKDARDCLRQGMNLDGIMKLCNDGKRFQCEEIIKASQIERQVSNAGQHTENKSVNKFLGGIRPGELTIWTGHSGHGKTTAALNLAYWVASASIPVMVMSFENTLDSVLRKLIEIQSGESLFGEDPTTGQITFNKTDSWMDAQIKKLDNLPIYFLNTRTQNGYFDVKAIETICEYGVKFHNVALFVIDHLHYFLKIQNANHQTHEIDESIRRISGLARNLSTHILLIAHPYKTENPQTGKLATLGLYCIKGSSSVVQEANNFVVIEKSSKDDKAKSQWVMLKSREWRTGKVIFDVLPNRNKYVAEVKAERQDDNDSESDNSHSHKKTREVVK